MSASRWRQLAGLGQSVWYDNVARPALRSGLLARIVEDDHVTGGTSNPSIFAQAAQSSDLYDDEIASAPPEESTDAVFQRLAIADIQEACDVVRDVWERTGGQDGYISIEEEASIAFDVEAAVARGHELRGLVDRPNVMIKVPGTEAGVRAFRRLTREGVSVNVTLLFARPRYEAVAEAYIAGLEERHAAGEDISAIASVASFFVSRIDGKVDAQLAADSPLRGRAALANAQLAYADVFLPAFTSSRWRALATAGANLQRPLWASTGVKDPAYPATLYVDQLVGAGTVTTVPDETLAAFRDHGVAAPTLHAAAPGARAVLDELERAGVDLDAVTRELESEGVKRFATAYEDMIASIAAKRGLTQGAAA
jgi:transaldolase